MTSKTTDRDQLEKDIERKDAILARAMAELRTLRADHRVEMPTDVEIEIRLELACRANPT